MNNQENYLNTPFLRKLNTILTNQLYKEVIQWDQTGTMIDIFDEQTVETDILPKFFRHSKFQSFVRQLNLYGFRKMKKKNCHRFRHPDLVKGSSLFSIKSQRKFKNSTQKSPSIYKSSSQQIPSHQQINFQPNNHENGCPQESEELKRIQTVDKIDNNIFKFITYPIEYQPIYPNSFYLNQVSYCQQFNPIQDCGFQTVYLPNVNNILFYN